MAEVLKVKEGVCVKVCDTSIGSMMSWIVERPEADEEDAGARQKPDRHCYTVGALQGLRCAKGPS